MELLGAALQKHEQRRHLRPTEPIEEHGYSRVECFRKSGNRFSDEKHEKTKS
jgi:hypothetical protein